MQKMLRVNWKKIALAGVVGAGLVGAAVAASPVEDPGPLEYPELSEYQMSKVADMDPMSDYDKDGISYWMELECPEDVFVQYGDAAASAMTVEGGGRIFICPQIRIVLTPAIELDTLVLLSGIRWRALA